MNSNRVPFQANKHGAARDLPLEFGDYVMLAAGQGGLDLGDAVRPAKLHIIGLPRPAQAKDSRQRRLVEPARLAGENAAIVRASPRGPSGNAVRRGGAAGAFVASSHAGRCEGKGGGRRGQNAGQKPHLALGSPLDAQQVRHQSPLKSSDFRASSSFVPWLFQNCGCNTKRPRRR